MANENGTWIMYGVSWDDPECLHTVDEAIEYINKVGFLPLFKNEIPGFSLEGLYRSTGGQMIRRWIRGSGGRLLPAAEGRFFTPNC